MQNISILKNSIKFMAFATTIAMLGCSSSPKVTTMKDTKPSIDKALHDGIDSMRWGAAPDRLGFKTRQVSIEKNLFNTVPIKVECFTKGQDTGSLHQLFEKKPKLNIYCFKNDHLFMALRLFKGYTGFNVLKPENALSSPIMESENKNRWVTWTSGNGDSSDEIDFYSSYYYKIDSGFAMITNDTLFHDNLDKPDLAFYTHQKQQDKNIYKSVNLEEELNTTPTVALPQVKEKKNMNQVRPSNNSSEANTVY